MKQKNLERIEALIILSFMVTGILFLWGLMADNFNMIGYQVINLVFLLGSISLTIFYVLRSKKNTKNKKDEKDKP
ncbi:hypothetical protein [Lactococcus lactis]|uniref:Uncharacterized protein n=1 Tax=Lactococcus lactis TaxID=1358 RepID=A0AAW5TM17_9LACT|nr:hypothetical protein [Lactococcus lactis]MCW2280169.1 hypothetical protein [Lactococcus lactis]